MKTNKNSVLKGSDLHTSTMHETLHAHCTACCWHTALHRKGHTMGKLGTGSLSSSPASSHLLISSSLSCDMSPLLFLHSCSLFLKTCLHACIFVRFAWTGWDVLCSGRKEKPWKKKKKTATWPVSAAPCLPLSLPALPTSYITEKTHVFPVVNSQWEDNQEKEAWHGMAWQGGRGTSSSLNSPLHFCTGFVPSPSHAHLLPLPWWGGVACGGEGRGTNSREQEETGLCLSSKQEKGKTAMRKQRRKERGEAGRKIPTEEEGRRWQHSSNSYKGRLLKAFLQLLSSSPLFLPHCTDNLFPSMPKPLPACVMCVCVGVCGWYVGAGLVKVKVFRECSASHACFGLTWKAGFWPPLVRQADRPGLLTSSIAWEATSSWPATMPCFVPCGDSVTSLCAHTTTLPIFAHAFLPLPSGGGRRQRKGRRRRNGWRLRLFLPTLLTHAPWHNRLAPGKEKRYMSRWKSTVSLSTMSQTQTLLSQNKAF